MHRNPFRSSAARLLAVGLAMTTLLISGLPALAQEPAPPVVPNVEPEPAAEAPLDERAAVEAALAALGGATEPPAGAILDMPAAARLADFSFAGSFFVYVPLTRKPNSTVVAPVTPVPTTPVPVTPTPVTPTPEPEPEERPDVAVTIWPKPSIWVARGGVLEYEIRLANYGDADTDQVEVVFPLNRSQYMLTSTSLDSKKGDWVKPLEQDRFTVVFGKLRAGERRTGKIYLTVQRNLDYGTILSVRATYDWKGSPDDRGRGTNWAPVLAGSGPSDAPYVWAQVTPDRGPAGTKHAFLSNRFLPGETVTTWLNLPGGGVRGLTLRGVADASGVVRLELASTGLAKGTYQLVMYGNRSQLTGVATFVVQ